MVLKVMKMPVASRVVFKVHKHNQGVCILYYIRTLHSSTMCCWNATCCYHRGRMSL